MKPRRLYISILMVTILSLSVAGASMAYFSDSKTGSLITFKLGTIQLESMPASTFTSQEDSPNIKHFTWAIHNSGDLSVNIKARLIHTWEPVIRPIIAYQDIEPETQEDSQEEIDDDIDKDIQDTTDEIDVQVTDTEQEQENEQETEQEEVEKETEVSTEENTEHMLNKKTTVEFIEQDQIIDATPQYQFIVISQGWVQGSDGWFYYKQPISSNTIVDFNVDVILNTPWEGDLKIFFEAVGTEASQVD